MSETGGRQREERVVSHVKTATRVDHCVLHHHEGEPLKRSILVVEDDPFMRMFMVDYLRDQNFEVHEAGHAEAALEVLETTPDLQIVVTDVQMPGVMDGRALAHYVRDRWPPTILVVASGTERLVEADLPTRSTFLAKPFRPAALLNAIQRLMPGED